MKFSVNTSIAQTHLLSKKKQSIVAALGVTFGISMFIFMNSVITGTNQYFEKNMLSSTPHVRLYNEAKLSTSEMMKNYFSDPNIEYLIHNPKVIEEYDGIRNSQQIMNSIKSFKEVIALTPEVSSQIIYKNGSTDINGKIFGVDILEEDKMFDVRSTMVSGNVEDLKSNINGLILGSGVAKKLNAKTGDYISISSAYGTIQLMQVVGIFKTTIKSIDNSKAYANILSVQRLLKKNRDYITDIKINIHDYNKAETFAKKIAHITGYTAEDWKSANEQLLAATLIRNFIANSVVITILIVAGFGIYNILNMTIYEKMKDIAILKATGFSGKDVISIFLQQALIIGIIGGTVGLILGYAISYLASQIYIGKGNLQYLPIAFLTQHYITGFLFGIITTLGAGYFPAKKASQIDPVQIIRG